MDAPHFIKQSPVDGHFGYFLFFMVTKLVYVFLRLGNRVYLQRRIILSAWTVSCKMLRWRW